MSELDMAYALDLAVLTREDATDRFIRSLSTEGQRVARDTQRLHVEFIQHCQAALTEDHDRAVLHADWLAKNAMTVASRWAAFRKAHQRFCETDCPPVFLVRREPE